MRLTPTSTTVAAMLAVVSLAIVPACSSDDTASPSDTTTGTVPRTTTTTTTAPSSGSTPGSDENQFPGLWLAVPAGITDEKGTVWAKPAAGETLRSPVDDGVGGVVYLRCKGTASTCSIEDATVRDKVPVPLGSADSLLGTGTYQQTRVLIASWTDPTIVPDQAADTSGLVAQLIDMDSGRITTLPKWFGWESSPFTADVENDQFAACFGEGESCGVSLGTTPDNMVAVPGMDPSTVMSLALDPKGKRLTWVETEPMTGNVNVVTMDLPSGTPTTVELQGDNDPPADDSVTDGAWVAIRTGETVAYRQLDDGAGGGSSTTTAPTTPVEGKIPVASGVTEMALRSSGGGGSANSVL